MYLKSSNISQSQELSYRGKISNINNPVNFATKHSERSQERWVILTNSSARHAAKFNYSLSRLFQRKAKADIWLHSLWISRHLDTNRLYPSVSIYSVMQSPTKMSLKHISDTGKNETPSISMILSCGHQNRVLFNCRYQSFIFDETRQSLLAVLTSWCVSKPLPAGDWRPEGGCW